MERLIKIVIVSFFVIAFCSVAFSSAFPTEQSAHKHSNAPVDVIRIVNDTLFGDTLKVFIDKGLASAEQFAAIDPARVQSLTIIMGGRSYIDCFIRKIIASMPENERPGKSK